VAGFSRSATTPFPSLRACHPKSETGWHALQGRGWIQPQRHHALRFAQGVPPRNGNRVARPERAWQTPCIAATEPSKSFSMRIRDAKTGRTYVSKRRRRFDNEHTPRELTFSCYKGYKFLNSGRTRKWFVEALEGARLKWPVDLWAWVLMPEHVHLIVMPRESGVPVGLFQGAVKEQVARKAIQWLEKHAPEWIPRITAREGARHRRRFWQPGGGYDRNIDDLGTLQNMIDYMHLNPVRRGLVQKAVDWSWSSARWYAGIRPVLIELDGTMPTIHESGTR
jgi:putative transposase